MSHFLSGLSTDPLARPRRFKSSPVNAIVCQALAGSPLRPQQLTKLDTAQQEQLKPPFSSVLEAREAREVREVREVIEVRWLILGRERKPSSRGRHYNWSFVTLTCNHLADTFV